MTEGTGLCPLPRAAIRACPACRASYRTDYRCCPTDGTALVIAGADPLIGTTLAGRYAIDALIGEGAMGRVYRAHHVRLVHKRYAIKVLLGDLAARPAMRMRFAREANNASKLDHPNVVGVLDFGHSDGLLYLVMELVDGPTLARVIRGGLDEARAIALARQLCDGLAHAHARGVVHRDFKPENVLVADHARIADFGLALSLRDDDARLTTSGVLCTPAYAAPEQLADEPVDHRTDLYALGATLYEMLVGRPPFAGDTRAVMAAKIAGDMPPLHVLPRRFAPVVARLLVRQPDARFSTACDVAAALDRASARRRWWFGTRPSL